jgi:hypothetical protein
MDQIVAASFSDSSGVQVQNEVVREVSGGGWLRYQGLNIDEGADALAITFACDDVNMGGVIQVRLDDQELAKLDVENSGGWGRFVTKTIPCSLVAGRHDLDLRFLGKAGPVASISRIQFLHQPANTLNASVDEK